MRPALRPTRPTWAQPRTRSFSNPTATMRAEVPVAEKTPAWFWLLWLNRLAMTWPLPLNVVLKRSERLPMGTKPPWPLK